MAPARQPQAQFSKDEKVLCFHMDMLYEAKVMDVQPGDTPGDGHRYKVHYKGWKNTWDDWVLADRIRPFDDEHKELAAQLHAQAKINQQKNSKQPKKNPKSGGESARGSEERGSAAAQGGARGGRRGKDWELEQVSGRQCNTLVPALPCLVRSLRYGFPRQPHATLVHGSSWPQSRKWLHESNECRHTCSCKLKLVAPVHCHGRCRSKLATKPIVSLVL